MFLGHFVISEKQPPYVDWQVRYRVAEGKVISGCILTAAFDRKVLSTPYTARQDILPLCQLRMS